MTFTLEVIFENGVLRPLSPLALPEHTRVRLAVDDLNDGERKEWLEQSQQTLTAAAWDNSEDDIFNELLAP